MEIYRKIRAGCNFATLECFNDILERFNDIL